MGGSDGDTQYKLSSNPPDTETCNGILFTSKHGQASQRLSLISQFFYGIDHDLKKIVCLISQQKKSAYFFVHFFFFFFCIKGSTDLKVISDKGRKHKLSFLCSSFELNSSYSQDNVHRIM